MTPVHPANQANSCRAAVFLEAENPQARALAIRCASLNCTAPSLARRKAPPKNHEARVDVDQADARNQDGYIGYNHSHRHEGEGRRAQITGDQEILLIR